MVKNTALAMHANILSEALDSACTFGHLNVVQWMAESTALGLRSNLSQLSKPLASACYRDHLNFVQWMVKNTALATHANILRDVLDSAYTYATYGHFLQAFFNGHLYAVQWMVGNTSILHEFSKVL